MSRGDTVIVMPLRKIALLAAAILLTSANGREETPADLYGPLFERVQQERVFADGKTFVDAVPRQAPAVIMSDYARAKPADIQSLRAFVLKHFIVPGETGLPATDIRAHVKALWPALVRVPEPPVTGSSALPLVAPYVVPGGRFREIYYWDSYFTMLGLKADGRDDLVEAMLDNFTSLIERYGHIPNGTRTYYLSRSQPPFFALMLDLSANNDTTAKARRLNALRTEYDWWMRGQNCLDATGACLRVVRMPDGSLLNRYWDDRESPRDESWAEDMATARKAALGSALPRSAPTVLRDLRAGAESGWDFSSRWLADGISLTSIHTTDIVPVDLNALLWAAERRIAAGCRDVADASCVSDFTRRASARQASLRRYLWQESQLYYADWDHRKRKPTNVLSAATLYPLFVGMASAREARLVADTARARLLAQGGLRTTTNRTGEQWDMPNGWAPLQWVAIDGLARYGHAPLAKDIAGRWLTTVTTAYRETGKMLEKYDVEEQKPGGGGEYPLQDGFGWTNGTLSALLERYPDLARP